MLKTLQGRHVVSWLTSQQVCVYIWQWRPHSHQTHISCHHDMTRVFDTVECDKIPALGPLPQFLHMGVQHRIFYHPLFLGPPDTKIDPVLGKICRRKCHPIFGFFLDVSKKVIFLAKISNAPLINTNYFRHEVLAKKKSPADHQHADSLAVCTAVGIALFSLYLRTLHPSVPGGDSGKSGSLKTLWIFN